MKTIYKLLILLIIASTITKAQNKSISGEYILNKVEVSGKSQNVFQKIKFIDDGNISMMNDVFGSWTYNKKTNEITIKSDVIKQFAGTRKILTHNKNQLILDDGKTKMFFTYLNPKITLEENTNSKLVGDWTIKAKFDNVLETKTLSFELPGMFKCVAKTEYSSSVTNGEWLYNSKDNSLFLFVQDPFLRGKSKLISISNNKFIIEIKGTKYTANRKQKSKIKFEKLNFTDADFYNEKGEYKYEAEAKKLPWVNNPYSIFNNLKQTKSLTYTYSKYDNDNKDFDSIELTSYITKAYESNNTYIMDNIFNGFDKNNIPDDAELPHIYINEEINFNNNPVFPISVESYRVVNKSEEINTVAGKYVCTLIEAVNDKGFSIKIWLVNNNPGIVAKVIYEKNDDFFHKTYYSVYELKEIKKNNQ